MQQSVASRKTKKAAVARNRKPVTTVSLIRCGADQIRFPDIYLYLITPHYERMVLASFLSRCFMPKQLGILTVTVGLILIIVSLVFFNIAEVRLWFPMTLIVAGVLAFSGINRYRRI
jgi:hypothetical protein